MTDQGQPHRKRMVITTAVLALMLICSVTITAYAMNSRTVIIRDDETTVTYNTTRTDANEILRAKEIRLQNDDYLDLSDFAEEGDCIIRIYRAKEIYLEDDGQVRRLRAAGNVQRLLELNGVELKERDTLSCLRTDPLVDGMRIIIGRAFDVAVLDGENTHSLTLTEGTVAQALALCELTLEGDDFVTPGPLTPLEPGLTIHVNRVSYRERTVETTLDYEIVTKKSASLDLGKVRIDQTGEKGKKETVYQDKYINGERVESIKLKETIL
ncbi:MAG: ubiquitin-like domain-containing protein, partial [Oscillospiraceae bacterium]|nr:ubiquitin-like domain-containing protein [Oscillospiraceae bacterium]